MSTPPRKPLGIKAYGSIGHLPGSRRGPADRGLDPGQGRICTEKARDKHDTIIVQEKVDGSCVAVAKLEGRVVPLIRAGYEAIHSHYEQHRMFAAWVFERYDLFEKLLGEGQRICGEWLAQAHGTRYALPHGPFVAFDMMVGHERLLLADFKARVGDALTTPRVISIGPPISIERVLAMLEPSAHGALDPVEGAVWRVERKGEVDFLAKYVRPDKVDGCYLPEVSGKAAVWNWRPTPSA